MPDLQRLSAAYQQAKGELLAERTPGGYWVGELSSSALATATAVSALSVVKKNCPSEPGNLLDTLIARGVEWLVQHQNEDGGFGDTDLSHSNIATTMLVVAALHLARGAVGNALRGVPQDLQARANAYIDSQGRLKGLRERYGIDKTFVVPIMTNCAIAGLLDWREIDPLPFELATVPQALYRFVGMPVVSYAIPALVAIGQAQFHHAPPRNPLTRLVRRLSIARSLKVLRRMQPDSGGYLEATPLTSFVVMSLASIAPPKPRPVVGVRSEAASDSLPSQMESGSEDSPRPLVGALNTVAEEVIREGVKFLAASIRPDGSWPIDTNLATWNTTLAINALAGAGEDVAELLAPRAVGNALRGVPCGGMDTAPADPAAAQRPFPTGNVLDWLLSCQHTKRHPFTGADPGGFGWSDLSGAVPDADDTPGAILAVGSLVKMNTRLKESLEIVNGRLLSWALSWLLYLQNRDGGWPTFCRGWGKLPFDRSGTDLTAHAMRAIAISGRRFKDAGDIRIAGGFDRLLLRIQPRAIAFLVRQQHPDGSWSPLWFGNQDHPTEDNPVYGTAKVLMAYRDLGLMDSPEAQRGVAWLVANQNADGGWGCGVWEKLGIGDLGLGISSSPTNPKSQIPNLKSSVEETALAVEALLAACPPSADARNAMEGVPYSALSPQHQVPNPQPPAPSPAASAAVEKGLTWLVERVERGEHRQPAPIGFYFAKLWYYERLYPLTFTVAALGRACQQFACHSPTKSGTDRQTQPLGLP